jgi:transcriptional regulator with XRE-family HTH domain
VAKFTLTHLLARLWELRAAHGLTPEAFAERSGISYKYYQAVEAGRNRELRLSTLEWLAHAYGLEVSGNFWPRPRRRASSSSSACRPAALPGRVERLPALREITSPVFVRKGVGSKWPLEPV